MFERSERALKMACGVVAALVLYRLVLALVHINPLYHVTIPQLPSLPVAVGETNTATVASAAAAPTQGKGTGAAAAKHGTNDTTAGTNLLSGSSNVLGKATNIVALATNKPAQGTNVLARNASSMAEGTNAVVQTTNGPAGATNGSTGPKPGTPPELAQVGGSPGRPRRMPPGAFPGMPGMPGMPSPGPALPPALQARIDRVIESEILAPVMRPLPMALLGIAGNSAFFRAPNGQTSLVKEGEESGGVKLLRIGVNRILVEENGEQKELTIFSGLGGDSLVSTQKNGPK